MHFLFSINGGVSICRIICQRGNISVGKASILGIHHLWQKIGLWVHREWLGNKQWEQATIYLRIKTMKIWSVWLPSKNEVLTWGLSTWYPCCRLLLSPPFLLVFDIFYQWPSICSTFKGLSFFAFVQPVCFYFMHNLVIQWSYFFVHHELYH